VHGVNNTHLGHDHLAHGALGFPDGRRLDGRHILDLFLCRCEATSTAPLGNRAIPQPWDTRCCWDIVAGHRGSGAWRCKQRHAAARHLRSLIGNVLTRSLFLQRATPPGRQLLTHHSAQVAGCLGAWWWMLAGSGVRRISDVEVTEGKCHQCSPGARP
jgi:hypothetical protein